ncbi:MAG: histidine phosphatase family protein [Muribaculaceae bacterium]|nr:histidine phosphatase family protein [Muribaculaceae bacterium]
MKTPRLFLPLFILISVVTAAQGGTGTTLPPELDGSMMPYDFSKVDTIPEIPDGLELVHISYVARHGARYLSSPKKIEKIYSVLNEANAERRLSDEGEAFLKYLNAVADSTDGRWGLLSPVGMEEQKRLGSDMARMFPALLNRGKVKEISTFVPRVIMTMYEFNHWLELKHQDLEIYTSSGHQNDSLLYCFDTFSNYRDFRDSGEWKEGYDDYVARHVSPEPARRLFSEFDGKDKKLRDLTMEMYGVMQGNRAAGFQAPTTRWFTVEEYRQCYNASNLKHYLRNTPNPLDPYCASATAMLIKRIISDADQALTSKEPASERNVFSGYFGHAETLLPLFAVMNIPGCYYPMTNYEHLDSEWKLQDITPLGANLTLIFMRDSDGVAYVYLRHNGQNVPAYPGAPDLIKWSDLKAYWLQRISSFSRPKARLL